MNALHFCRRSLSIVLIFAAFVVFGCSSKPAAVQAPPPTDDAAPTSAMTVSKPVIRLSTGSHPTVDVVGLLPEELTALTESKPSPEQWQKLFAVYVNRKGKRVEQPAVLGSYRISNSAIRFTPRFPLMAGVAYRAVFHPERLPGRSAATDKPLEKILYQSKPVVFSTTYVENVYPSEDQLPENQLKFYIHFSAPMSQGEALEHIHLLRADGKADSRAFLDLPQELWDPDCQRLTLFLDPGRVKRGLKPREEFGPVLENGASYTLFIDRDFKDADGNPLKVEHRKTFSVLPPQEERLAPKQWIFEVPDSGTRSAFVLNTPRPLDRALMQRMVWISDEQGKQLPGQVEAADKEKSWRFTPTKPWKAGRFYLVADTRLEDLAGNSIARPFEVDMLQPNERPSKAETVQIPFDVP